MHMKINLVKHLRGVVGSVKWYHCLQPRFKKGAGLKSSSLGSVTSPRLHPDLSRFWSNNNTTAWTIQQRQA